MKSARLALWLLALWALGVPSGFSPARAQEAQPYWCDLCEGERGRHSDGCPTRPAAKRLPRLDLAALAAQRARAASAAGDREQAAAGYRELVRLRPQSASAWNNLGNALWGLKRLAEAGRAYEESFARRPAGHARGNLARLLRARRARDRLVLRAAALDEARAHYAAGQHLAAIEALGLIPRPDPHVWQFIGQAQARLGRYPAAVAACELALAESPLTAERRARLEADREAWAAREGALYDRVLARGALAEAKDLLGRGRSAPARDLLERLVRAQPNHRVAHDRLGLLLLGRRRLRDAVWAEAAFRRSVSLEPDLSATWTNLGVCLLIWARYCVSSWS
ncbi:MAG: tetratricopeptide repeat protein, partial [Planctomycetes bacterium]|nr:tetratricopeptide repeat protein [Planctomycetota bacterium]